MSRLTFDSSRFQCHLQCGQCNRFTKNGNQCRRRVCFGYPSCWQHTIADYGIKIRSSTVINGGKGLFATRNIPQGTWICPYLGELITETCLNIRYPGDETAIYVEPLRPGVYIDSACQRGIGSMANGLFTPNGIPLPASFHNVLAFYRPELDQVWLWARRNIPQNTELFLHYGPDYRLQGYHNTRRRQTIDTRPC
jgi:hypothetical protein